MTDKAEVTGNAELLNFIYQNSQMGKDITGKLIGMTEDVGLIKHLTVQSRQYEKINASACKMLNEHGVDEAVIGALDKIKIYLMINLQTLTDKSSSHIAEMLIVGSTMGIIDAVRNIKKYSEARPGIKCLMETLRKIEEDNIEQLLEFV